MKVIINCAISLDGKLATVKGDSSLSDREDLIRVHKLRAEVDAVAVGGRTVKIDNPHLTVRYVPGKNPVRVIIDGDGILSSIPSDAHILDNSAPTLIYTTEAGLSRYPEYIRRKGVIVAGRDYIKISDILRDLAQKKIKTLLVEGGGTLIWSFISERFVDEINVAICPVILGGAKAVTLADGIGFPSVKKALHLKLRKTQTTKTGIIIASYDVEQDG